MKEYQSKAGGRYIFNEDIENLQELALSVTSLFKDCGQNFVISGCEVTNNNGTIIVQEGIVWLDGKIRRVAATSGTYQHNLGIHIVAKQTDGPTIAYADGTNGKQYAEFGTRVKIDIDLEANDVTGIEPHISIKPYTAGKQFPNLRTVFFENYAVMKDESGVSEEIKMLGSGATISGVGNGVKSDFYANFTSPDPDVTTGVPNESGAVTGVAINGVPMFTHEDLLLIKKLVLQTLFVKSIAYIKELYVDNAHIPNTVRVLASAAVKQEDGTSSTGLTARITNTQLHISGTLSKSELGDGTLVYDDNSHTTGYYYHTFKIVNESFKTKLLNMLPRTPNSSDSYILDYAIFHGSASGDIFSSGGGSVYIFKDGTIRITRGHPGTYVNGGKMCISFNLMYAGE